MIKKMLPYPYRIRVETMLKDAGMSMDIGKFFAKALIVSILAATVAGFFAGEYVIFVYAGVFGGTFALMHGLIYIAMEKRVNFVEEILPDTLELMAANMRAGFIPSRALVLSAREEFGPLADAIKESGKEMLTGGSLEDAFSRLGKFVKSDILGSTMKLINEGTKSGGELVALLEETAIDIRRKHAIKNEVKANILMYGIFIVFAGAIAAPVLYALTIHLVAMMSQFGASTSAGTSSVPMMGMGMFSGGGGGAQISPDFLFIFSILSLIITAFFSGLIIGIIDSGKEKSGIKYIPIFVILALVIFLVSNGMLDAFFAGMM
ncbi:MAG: type II secretion system F family protein [Candidatus Aenigmarchaeota archaeon]|nr:type II secretion system F family protein [Candidatus Aenigmarchaeota archaeon]